MNETRNDRIRESIDKIEPAEGARGRMLANIKRKAEEQSAQDDIVSESEAAKVMPFNRIIKWALPIAACFVAAILGITVLPGILHPSTIVNNDPPAFMGSPFIPVDNASEFESQLGIRLDAPADADYVEYSIADGKIAAIYFTLDGHGYDLRASCQSGDFSGLSGTVVKEETIDAENNAVFSILQNGNIEFLRITWTDGPVNYVLMNTDGGAESEIKAIYEKVK